MIMPPMPLPASMTTLIGASSEGFTKECMKATKASRTFFSSTLPGVAATEPILPARIRSSMSLRPESRPMGMALARVILKPLYWPGLWDAVTTMPPSVSVSMTAK
ncbi:hypothetical protein D3C80_1985440 [compost metagenome]